jgi:cell division protein FtsI (penicillin-binding protein 3)
VSNHAISDIYEFGSATKALMLAIALEEGCISPDAPISCGNGVFRHGRAEVYDPRSVGVRTMREATIRSVNLPFARLGPKLGKERLLRYLTNFGLGSVTGIALPGEVRGQVETNLNNWTDFTLTRVPFGQGIGCTQLQLTRAFCAIGNKGQLMEPRVVSHIEAVDGRLIERFPPKCVRTVVSPRTCEITLDLLTGPVERKGGTARAAALATHTVAGKTGTGQVSDGHVYLKDVHTCSFLGLTPAKDPELCISVVFDRCGPGRTGGGVAAPVFREIAAQAVEWLGIPPDKLEDNKRPPALARPGTKQPAASALAATRR